MALAGTLLCLIWNSTFDQIHWNTTSGAIALELSVEFGLPLLLVAASLAQALFRGQRKAIA